MNIQMGRTFSSFQTEGSDKEQSFCVQKCIKVKISFFLFNYRDKWEGGRDNVEAINAALQHAIKH